jgi:glycosyltransferase involved in cell wall biosynthesis
MAPPRVSVVIPTYNRAELLQQAIDSVLAQTFADFEVIVVDDASTDETGAVATAIDDDRIRYIRHEQNRHGAAARNTGIEAARGEYVAFLDDDDEWYPEKLAKQVAVMEDSPADVALVYCWAEVYDGDERINVRRPDLAGDIFEQTLTGNPIGATSTLLLRTDALVDIGGFDESLHRGQDSDLIRRVSHRYAVDFAAAVLVKYRWQHDGEQITDTDDENLYHSVDCHRATLAKFDDYLAAHPAARAAVYREIAWLYAQTGDWRRCCSFSAKSVGTAPLSPAVYKGLRRIAGGVRVGIGRSRRALRN